MRFPAAIRSARRAPLLQVLKSAGATIAAWLIAGWLIPGPLPVFAAIAALLCRVPFLGVVLIGAAAAALLRLAGIG